MSNSSYTGSSEQLPSTRFSDYSADYLIQYLFRRPEEITDQLLSQFELQGTYFGDGAFVLLLFSFEGLFREYSIGTDLLSQIYKMENYLSSCISMAFSGFCIHYTFRIDGHIPCVLCFPHGGNYTDSQAEQVLENIKARAIDIHNSFAEKFTTTLRMNISAFSIGLIELVSAYRQSLDTYEYYCFLKEIDGYTGIANMDNAFCFKDKKEVFVPNSTMVTSFAVNFVKRIQTEPESDSRDYALEILDYILSVPPHTHGSMQLRLLEFLDSFELELIRQNVISADYFRKAQIYSNLYLTRTGPSLVSNFKDAIDNLLNDYNLQTEHSNIGEFDKIMKYIDSNITNVTLSVSGLSEHFNMSQPVFTSKFKAYTGETPSAYIRKKRIDYAKYLLTGTNFTAEQISEAVGFGSAITMQRLFKKYTGETPGAFRNKNTE